MPNQEKPKSVTWDIFSSAPDRLRELSILATQLGSNPTCRVRVFLDDPEALTGFNARIDSNLWVQPLANYELWRLRLADIVHPADNIVCMSGGEMPTKYRERIVYGIGNHRRILRIWPLGQGFNTDRPATPGAEVSGSSAFDVYQDEAVGGAGVIRSQRNMCEMRQRWRATAGLTKATMESLGMPDFGAPDALIVLCAARNAPSSTVLCRVLSEVADRPVRLIVSDPDNGAVHGVSCAHGQISCNALPPLTWPQLDEIAWCCDLIFTDQHDIALRAIESGAPMLWLQEEDGLFDWYFDELDPAFKRSFSVVAHQFRNVNPPYRELRWFSEQLDALVHVADEAARRIAQAPQLADVLPSVSPWVFDQAKSRYRYDKMKDPVTTPMVYPDSVKHEL